MNPKGWYVTDGFPYILDLTDCRSWKDLHDRIRKLFAFPDYYGENWDAMWDCLNDLFRKDDSGEIIVRGAATIPKEMQEELEELKEIFADLHDKRCPGIVCRFE